MDQGPLDHDMSEEDIERGQRKRPRMPSRPPRPRDREPGELGMLAGAPVSNAQERGNIRHAAHAVPYEQVWDAIMTELYRMSKWQRGLRLYVLLRRLWRQREPRD